MMLNNKGQVVNLPANFANASVRDAVLAPLREVLEPSQHFPRKWATIETRARFKTDKVAPEQAKQGQKK